MCVCAPNTLEMLNVVYYYLWVRFSHYWYHKPSIGHSPCSPYRPSQNPEETLRRFLIQLEKSSIMISPWPSLETTTPTSLSISFIRAIIVFAFLLDIFILWNYAFVLWILMIHFLLVIELDPFDLPWLLWSWFRSTVPPFPLLVFFYTSWIFTTTYNP